MISVAQARETARERLRRKRGEWAVALPPSVPPEPLLSLGLRPPTERQMRADERAAEAWVLSWSDRAPVDGVEIDWEYRTWRSIGQQEVPVRVRFADAYAIAAFVGGQPAREWLTMSARVHSLRETLGSSDGVALAIRRYSERLLAFDDATFAQVEAVAAWLAHRHGAGLRPRQLPFRGVDAVWFATHRALVTALASPAIGSADVGVIDTDVRVRLRVLDEGLALGGLRDVSAPVAQVSALAWTPRVVLVVENLESLLALPTWPGVVGVHGTRATVGAVGRMPWVRAAEVVYWGDLDSNAFADLDRLRSELPQVRSVLMDAATLEAHRDLCVVEPRPARGAYAALTPSEHETLALLRDGGDLRLEQERVPWETALAALEGTVLGTSEG